MKTIKNCLRNFFYFVMWAMVLCLVLRGIFGFADDFAQRNNRNKIIAVQAP